MTAFWTKHPVFATASIALIHFMVTLALLFSSFRGDRFDRGIPRSLLEEIQAGVLYIFMFPLINNPFTHLLPSLPTALGYGIFILNSLIWGVAILWIMKRWHKGATSD